MSRRKDNYENSRWLKFKRWVDGEIDPLAHGMEIRRPEEAVQGKAVDGLEAIQEKAVGGPESVQEKAVALAASREKVQACPEAGQGKVQACLEAIQEKKAQVRPAAGQDKPQPRPDAASQFKEGRGIRYFRRFYQVMSILLCFSIIIVLLWTVAYLPIFGNAGNPDNNEVSARYIEQGLDETGAVNIVTGMILDYRAFDTFGESCVLFIASCCVLALLRIDAGEKEAKKRLADADDRHFEPKNDLILQKCACLLVPLILIFGIYIVLNGHLSPGGGFSGGAVLGSGLILYLNAFGFKKIERFFTEKVYRRITLGALTFYCLAKSYSFFTGANHLNSGIPLGTPGAILSSGLILPLNICVGLVVACTMYAFYALFRKGGM